jgi:formate hydrogenlyase transcriptional activator
MGAQASRAIGESAVNQIAVFEKDAGSAEAAFDNNELPSSGSQRIVGDSPALRRVLDMVRIVAPTDATVLINGETGTGKELIAKAIHNQSSRRHAQFVRMSCAAIPSELMESELFGHEKGAFTGAIAQTIGRFQLAHKGTLFLDEIGDLPLHLQSKLLRVLQEQEFERLGSGRTIKVDVRIVAATNQDLGLMVRERRFREDLYYRLDVFPVVLPPLRMRTEDIPLLVHHFVSKFSHRMNKGFSCVSDEVMEVLRRYDWPGNIRELQNFLLRAVVMSPGPEFRLPAEELKRIVTRDPPGLIRTLAEAEREHILRVLEQADWVIGGRYGAAVRLGLPRTTLLCRMRRLGIAKGNIPEIAAAAGRG